MSGSALLKSNDMAGHGPCGAVVRLVAPEELSAADTASWEALSADASEPNIFTESWCLLPAIAAFAGDRPIRLLWIEDSDGLIGVMPIEIGSAYGRFPVRHVRNWVHHNAFLGSPLVRAGAEQAFWAAAFQTLNDDQGMPGFVHINGLVEGGPLHRALEAHAAAVVYRMERALLQSDLSPDDYYAATVRKKKRKELNRLANRFEELGKVEYRRFGPDDDLNDWREAFFRLEAKGWKGDAGSALASAVDTRGFFSALIDGAHQRGRLDFLRIDLNGEPVAMLVNLLASPGSFSFKIAFDEDYARYSPGVMIERFNYGILERGGIDWMDSCAAADHPMINSLWGERRSIIRVTVPLTGYKRRMVHDLVRAGEDMMAAWRGWQNRATKPPVQEDDE